MERDRKRDIIDAEINDTQKNIRWNEKALHTHSPPLQHYALKRPKTKINTPILSDLPKCMPNHVS